MDSHNLHRVLIYLYFVISRSKRHWDASSWKRSPDREASCTGAAYTKHAAGVTQRMDTGALNVGAVCDLGWRQRTSILKYHLISHKQHGYEVQPLSNLAVDELYMSFIFLSNTTIYQLTHISLCIIEFIGHTMPLHVLAHGAIFRRYINKPYTIELCILYGPIFFIFHCVLQ
jgi:hypothetical protein